MEPMSENCNNCYNRHINSAATHWCPFCSEGLCSSCTEHHQASKISKSHSLVSISDYQKLPTYIQNIKNCCEAHEEPFQLYCQTHEQCCCLSCVKESHSECKGIESLNDVIKDVKSSPALEDIETSLKSILCIYGNIRENRIENKARLPEQKEKIMAEVQSIRKSINDHLDKLMNAIEATLLLEFEAANLKIDELLIEMEDRNKHIRQLIEEEDVIKQLSTDLQIFLGLPFFQGRILKETEYIETLQREHKTDELDLTFDTFDLDSFCKEYDSFGTLSVSQSPNPIKFNIGKKETAQIIMQKDGKFEKLVLNIQQIQYPERDSEIKITGCTILPNGQMLFADNLNDELFMRSFCNSQLIDCRRIISFHGIRDVTLIDSSKAAVSNLAKKEIVIVDLLMGERLNSFPLDDKCWGIEFFRGNLIVRSVGVFLTMNAKTGDIVNRTKQGDCLTYVTVLDDKIFGSNRNKGIVYCCNPDGEALWQFQNEKLKYPCDLTTDDQGFIYVTGTESDNVIVISPDGKTCNEILNQSNGLDAPTAIHFEKTLGLLLVCNKRKGAVICTIK